MKKTILSIAFAAIVVSTIFTSCQKEDVPVEKSTEKLENLALAAELGFDGIVENYYIIIPRGEESKYDLDHLTIEVENELIAKYGKLTRAEYGVTIKNSTSLKVSCTPSCGSWSYKWGGCNSGTKCSSGKHKNGTATRTCVNTSCQKTVQIVNGWKCC